MAAPSPNASGTANTLPTPNSVGDLVTMLVGHKVKVAASTPLAVTAVRGVATYVDDTDRLVFVALADMAFLASVGAALAMIPAPVVLEAVRTGKPSPVLLENAYEVMNIVASLYNDAEGKGLHVKIHRLLVAPPIAPELAPRIAKPIARRDMDVQLVGYPNGKLTLLAVT